MSIYITFFPGNHCANYKSKYDYIHLNIVYINFIYVPNIIMHTFIYNKVTVLTRYII